MKIVMTCHSGIVRWAVDLSLVQELINEGWEIEISQNKKS